MTSILLTAAFCAVWAGVASGPDGGGGLSLLCGISATGVPILMLRAYALANLGGKSQHALRWPSLAMVMAVALIVSLHWQVPLRVRFRLSKSALERLVATPPSTPAGAANAGLFTVSEIRQAEGGTYLGVVRSGGHDFGFYHHAHGRLWRDVDTGYALRLSPRWWCVRL